MVLFRALLIFGALFGTSLAAFGATSANLSVSASIVGNGHCTVTTPNTLQFGNLDAFNPANQTATVQIVVNCVGIGNKGTTGALEWETRYLYMAVPVGAGDLLRLLALRVDLSRGEPSAARLST